MNTNAHVSDLCWASLYRTGGLAALIAGIIFRRNLGVEIAVFAALKQPDSITGWFELLQTNRLLGLSYLNLFDIVNYLLVGLMFLALYVLLHRVHPARMAVAAVLGFLGITVYLATNTAFSLLALSDQYAAAPDDSLLAAGQAALALNRFSLAGAQPGSGGYLSLLLVAAAGLLISLVMLRSRLFSRAAALVGIAANTLDLVYCAAFPFVPAAAPLLGVLFIPAAGLLLLVWHVMVGWRLFRLGKALGQTP